MIGSVTTKQKYCPKHSTKPRENSLFERIGGIPGIDAMLVDFYDLVLSDKVLAPFFAGATMGQLRNMQREFFAMALGGGTDYSGKSLECIHRKYSIEHKHFARFVYYLLKTLHRHNVEEDGIQSIIRHIHSYTDSIVTP